MRIRISTKKAGTVLRTANPLWVLINKVFALVQGLGGPLEGKFCYETIYITDLFVLFVPIHIVKMFICYYLYETTMSNNNRFPV